MDTEKKAAAEAEAACEAMVKERLDQGGWVSAQEWIAMRKAETQKARSDAELLASFW